MWCKGTGVLAHMIELQNDVHKAQDGNNCQPQMEMLVRQEVSTSMVTTPAMVTVISDTDGSTKLYQ